MGCNFRLGRRFTACNKTSLSNELGAADGRLMFAGFYGYLSKVFFGSRV